MRGIVPLRLHKMHMRIPEARNNNTALAGDRLNSFGYSQMLSDLCDNAMTDHNCHVAPYLRFR